MIRLRLVQLRRYAAALFALVLITNVTAHAALIAIEDNNVLKSASGTTQTNGTTLNIKEATTLQTNARIGFIKFDLSSIVASITNTGVFTVTTADVAASNYTLRAYALNTGAAGFNWTEAGINYTNRPAPNNLANPLVDTTLATAVGTDINVTGGTALGTKMSFSFSNLESYRQSDNTLTFILLITAQTNSGSSFLFSSSEGAAATAPQLTVIPEPASIGLIGLCLMGALVRYRQNFVLRGRGV